MAQDLLDFEQVHAGLDAVGGLAVAQAVQRREVVGELGGRELVDLVVEILAHSPDGACVGVDGLGPQALESEMFEVALVALLEVGGGVAAAHPAISWDGTLHNHPVRINKGETCSVDRSRIAVVIGSA